MCSHISQIQQPCSTDDERKSYCIKYHYRPHKLRVKTHLQGNIVIIIILNICDRGRLKGCLCWTGGATENGVGSYPQMHCTVLLYYFTTAQYHSYLSPSAQHFTSVLLLHYPTLLLY